MKKRSNADKLEICDSTLKEVEVEEIYVPDVKSS
jgi:hypothetical protein